MLGFDWRGMENGTNSTVAVTFYFLKKQNDMKQIGHEFSMIAEYKRFCNIILCGTGCV